MSNAVKFCVFITEPGNKLLQEINIQMLIFCSTEQEKHNLSRIVKIGYLKLTQITIGKCESFTIYHFVVSLNTVLVQACKSTTEWKQNIKLLIAILITEQSGQRPILLQNTMH